MFTISGSNINLGATTLLIDEDTSATNFLVRDRRMQELIKSEPISPFVSKVRLPVILILQYGC